MKIAVASGKGGVGKSMLASSLALFFAQKGQSVVAVDADVDAPNLHLWLGQKENWDTSELVSTTERPEIDPKKCRLCGRCVEICQFQALKIDKKLKKVVVNPFFCEGCGACQVVCPHQATRMKKVTNGEIKSFQDVAGLPLFSAQLYPGETGSGKIVDQLLAKADKTKAGLTVVDVAAGTGCPVIAALKEVDLVILVAEPSLSSLADLERVLQVVNHFQLPFKLVINKWGLNNRVGEKIASRFAEQLLGKISYDKKIFQAIAQLTPVLKTDLPVKQEIEKICEKVTACLD